VSAEYTTGRLLVATPQIEEGVFKRSVVLVLHHDMEGAQGVVLNRPLDADIEDVLPGWEEHLSEPHALFQGGPVQVDSALGLVTVPGDVKEPSGVMRLFGSVGLVNLDTPPLLVAPEIGGMRIFAGYAGWSPDQLDAEIRTGSWYVVDAEVLDAFTDEPGELWRRVLRRQVGSLSWVALFPDDPGMN
jgi:putative transcriptional regulator